MKKEIRHLPNYFVVDNIKLIPHLSLWHIKTSKKKLDEIIKELKQLTKNLLKLLPLNFMPWINIRDV